MPIVTQTRAQIRHAVASLLDDLIITGTAGANSATNAIIDTKLTYPNTDDDRIVGGELTIYDDTLVGQSADCINFIPGSDKVEIVPVLSGSPVNMHYEIHKRWRAAEYNRAIALAEQEAVKYALVDFVDEQHVLDNLLSNGNMFLWSNGASAAPDGWTLVGAGGAIAKESSLVKHGVYSAKGTAAVNTATYIYQNVADYARYAGKSFLMKGYIFCGTADRVRLALADGVDTYYSSYHNGQGWCNFDDLAKSGTIANAPTQLQLQCRIESGAILSAYFGRIYLRAGDHVWEYNVPSGATWISQLLHDWGQHGEFEEIDRKYWYIKETSTRQIAFRPELWTPSGGAVLRIIGQKYPTVMSADTSNSDIEPAFLVARSTQILAAQKGEMQLAAFYKDMADRLKMSLPRVKADSQRVEAM